MAKRPAEWPAILVDTREQLPWDFRGHVCELLGVTSATQRGTLATGDYALVEAPDLCRIERKSLGDFVASVTHEHERFMREMARLAAHPIRAVVVEGDLSQVVRSTRQASPHSVVASALKCTSDYGIPVVWANSRPWAEWQAAWLLRRAWERRTERPEWVATLALKTSELWPIPLDWSA